MMPSLLSFHWNGAAFEPCEAVALADRGFRYGMSFFESIAVRGGRAEFLEAHLARLAAACRRCGWPLDGVALETAGARLEGLARSADGPLFSRIYITAGEGGPADAVMAPGVFVFAEPRPLPARRAIRVRVHPGPFVPVLGGLKTANYWPNAEALRQARGAGADEALLFNPAGELVSACMANVFVELDGTWVTPPVSCGARAGVTREWVLGRREVVERTFHREELARARACFLTSCWAGPVPVAELEGRRLETRFAETLGDDFREGAAWGV